MLFDKPSEKTTGRMKFYGTTPLGNKVCGYFFRIHRRSMQIKMGDKWHIVNKIESRRVAVEKISGGVKDIKIFPAQNLYIGQEVRE